MEQQRKKDYFRINRGLNTESNEINFPDGFTTDERNYELLVDGSRRRRKGIAQESSGSDQTIATISGGHKFDAYKWRAAGGDTDSNFIVIQAGAYIYFYADGSAPSSDIASDVIELTDFQISPAALELQIASEECQFAAGRGTLIVTHKYCNPFVVEYDPTNDRFGTRQLTVLHRDYYGIEDGVTLQTNPTSLSEEHEYNLRNRGWPSDRIDAYFSDEAAYPNKIQAWWSGYRRQVDALYADADGIQTWDSDKVVAEVRGNSSAPQGSLLLNPLDTRYSAIVEGEGTEIEISSWQMTSGNPKAGGTVEITCASAHGRSTNDYVTISGNTYETSKSGSLFSRKVNTLDGFWQITVTSSTVFTFTLPANSGQNTIEVTDGAGAFGTMYPGYLAGGVSLPKSDGEAVSAGFTACAFFAGRVWYAGVDSTKYKDTVFFSKITRNVEDYGKCYAKNDPTNPELNGLEPDDGGFIEITGMGDVMRMIPLRDSVIIFADNGVWEVGGRGNNAFTAGSYGVRKITESGCNSQRSPIAIGNSMIYTGPRGIHLISPNQYTSVLEESSLSEDRIQTLWNNIHTSDQNNVQTAYDESLQRVYFLYDDNTASLSNHYTNILILDLRIGGFYKYAVNSSLTTGLLGAFVVTNVSGSTDSKQVKFIVHTDATTMQICDTNQSDYVDFDGAESPLPYMVTGWDGIGDYQRRRQAPIITVYAKRTETGYTETGNGYDPINESSNLLTAYWDWTDDSVSGKIGSQNETYRHVRGFVPSGTDDVDGYPVVVTRNKVRGRGRVLQLRFDGATGKDSHILGFTINYKVSRGR